ncbi:MAG: zinc finger domain-containing protein, partial [Nitrospinota bacterium]
ARVVLFLPEDYLKALKPYERVMAEVFITSEAVIASGDSPPPAAYKSSLFPGLSVLVEPARGRKCERCWTVRETVGCSEEHPEICDRCAAVIG